MNFLSNKVILITGGTGTFGKAVIRKIMDSDFKKLIVFSRDELKQFELMSEFKLLPNFNLVQFYLGDIRDSERVNQVMHGVDIVIHAAAMKQVSAAEDNPLEAIKTNVFGTENIVRSSIENQVDKVISLSTDKAANPANLYGATKLCSDKLIIAGNSFPGDTKTKFSVVRYGNVLGSRGSVIPYFKSQIQYNEIPITDIRMTRFWITSNQASSFVLNRLSDMQGGEIFIPKIPSFKVLDVAKIICPNIPIKIIGIRPGEKLHETMITTDDSYNTIEMNEYYVVLSHLLKNNKYYKDKGIKVAEDFSYTSENNHIWFSDREFKETLVRENLI